MESRNLLKNPKPADDTGWKALNCATEYDGSSMRMSCSAVNCAMDYNSAQLAPGDWVFTAYLTGIAIPGDFPYAGVDPGGEHGRVMTVTITKQDNTMTYAHAFLTAYNPTRRYSLPFTVPADVKASNGVSVRLWGVKGSATTPNACRWKEVAIIEASEYERLNSKEHIVWFDGDGYKRGGGALLALFVRMWTMTAWWWSHEHDDCHEPVSGSVLHAAGAHMVIQCDADHGRGWAHHSHTEGHGDLLLSLLTVPMVPVGPVRPMGVLRAVAGRLVEGCEHFDRVGGEPGARHRGWSLLLVGGTHGQSGQRGPRNEHPVCERAARHRARLRLLRGRRLATPPGAHGAGAAHHAMVGNPHGSHRSEACAAAHSHTVTTPLGVVA